MVNISISGGLKYTADFVIQKKNGEKNIFRKNIFPNVEHDIAANTDFLEIYLGMVDLFSSILKPKI